MKDKIISKAAGLYFKYGIKNVSMDQIAGELGISKKTIYQYFSSKEVLVKETADFIFDQIQTEIDRICMMKLNPYEELFKIKDLIKEHLKHADTSPQYQLKKYYPEIAVSLEQKKFDSIMECLEHNLNKGVKQGFYKENLNKEFIKRMYFANTINLSDPALFPAKLFDKNETMDMFLNMFLSGISTKKGRKKLKSLVELEFRSI